MEKMAKMIVRAESMEDFLARGGEIAAGIDQGLPLKESCVRSFQDPEDLLALFTTSRRELLAEILRHPDSVKELAARLQRGVADVERDVCMLIEGDIVAIENDIVQPIAETVVFEPIPQFASEA